MLKHWNTPIFPNSTRQWVICLTCLGYGEERCHCEGNGCNVCGGHGHKDCTVCHGLGEVQGPNYDAQDAYAMSSFPSTFPK